ncbi:MAG: ATP-binding protein [Bacteroidetes bacterium]|nr:ATP-binding protein [Bacteroidota bacterium]
MLVQTTHNIDIEKIGKSLQANFIVGQRDDAQYTSGIYASDLMSDVLAYGKPGSVLLTGLNTIQAVISAYMAEFRGIIFLRSKVPDDDMIAFAREKGLVVLTTEEDMYEACVEIANIECEVADIKDIHKPAKKVENIATYNFHIDGHDFASAGLVSTHIKTILKSIGYNPLLIRRVAISTYEAEMNVVMHAKKADVMLTTSEKEIQVLIRDEGKGIEDIELAMKEGYSTATDEQRAMGFGAGMGLPNIKRNTDNLQIESQVGKGTTINAVFYVK